MDLNQCAGKVHSVLFRGGVTSENESESCSVVSESLPPRGLYSPWNSPGQNTGVGSLSLFQGIFPTQGLNPGLCLHLQNLQADSLPGEPPGKPGVTMVCPKSNCQITVTQALWGFLVLTVCLW